MHFASTNQSEIRAVVETIIELTNLAERASDNDVRSILQRNGFSRSKNASKASYRRLQTRLKDLEPLVRDLPLLSVQEASRQINEQLVEFPISPAITDHHDFGPHMHWTSTAATFDDQVIADILMGLALEICDNGTIRFGTCGASNCDDMFYDSTRNRSRRFCADPKCASRTHTADHRARQDS